MGRHGLSHIALQNSVLRRCFKSLVRVTGQGANGEQGSEPPSAPGVAPSCQGAASFAEPLPPGRGFTSQHPSPDGEQRLEQNNRHSSPPAPDVWLTARLFSVTEDAIYFLIACLIGDAHLTDSLVFVHAAPEHVLCFINRH